MFYFISIKNSLWILFIMNTDYNGNYVCRPKRIFTTSYDPELERLYCPNFQWCKGG